MAINSDHQGIEESQETEETLFVISSDYNPIDAVPLYQSVYLKAKDDYDTGKDSHSPVDITELLAKKHYRL